MKHNRAVGEDDWLHQPYRRQASYIKVRHFTWLQVHGLTGSICRWEADRLVLMTVAARCNYLNKEVLVLRLSD